MGPRADIARDVSSVLPWRFTFMRVTFYTTAKLLTLNLYRGSRKTSSTSKLSTYELVKVRLHPSKLLILWPHGAISLIASDFFSFG